MTSPSKFSEWGLAVDPGFAHLGLCVARLEDGIPSARAIRTVKTGGDGQTPEARLTEIACTLIESNRSAAFGWIAYEEQSAVTAWTKGGTNVHSRRVLEVCGMLRMLAAVWGCPVVTIRPQTLKRIVAGSSRAGKAEVKEAVTKFFRLGKPVSEHASDACGVWLAAAVQLGLMDDPSVSEKPKSVRARRKRAANSANP